MTPILSATLLRTQSDARLAALTREGHERAFEAIVERYRRTLHRYLRRMLPESRSEDALQQTFIKAWSSLGKGGVEVRDLKPWLYRIAHNTALDALKRSGYDYDELQYSLHSPHAPESDLERRTVMRETLAGVAALPDRQREALLRVAVEGQSRGEDHSTGADHDPRQRTPRLGRRRAFGQLGPGTWGDSHFNSVPGGGEDHSGSGSEGSSASGSGTSGGGGSGSEGPGSGSSGSGSGTGSGRHGGPDPPDGSPDELHP